jgi:flagellar hook protein FlgE
MTQGAGTSTELYDVDKGDPPFTTIDPPNQFSTTHVDLRAPRQGASTRSETSRLNPNMVLPAKDTTTLSLGGNLDAGLPATQSGGILDLAPGGNRCFLIDRCDVRPHRPDDERFFRHDSHRSGRRFRFAPIAGFETACRGCGGPAIDGPGQRDQRLDAGKDAYPPAATSTQTVYDQQGNARVRSLSFFTRSTTSAMVGSIPLPVPVKRPTLGMRSIRRAGNLLRTRIWWAAPASWKGKSRAKILRAITEGIWGDQYTGDLLYFNTDGSLATPGANDINQLGNPPRADIAATPRIYLPAIPIFRPANGGDGVTSISISFGTVGKRDGIIQRRHRDSYSGTYLYRAIERPTAFPRRLRPKAPSKA